MNDPVAGIDQVGAALKSIAPAVAQFYKALRSEDMGRLDAALVVASWITASSSTNEQ